MIEPLLLATTPVATFAGARPLSGATGFFYSSDDGRLHLVTCRHVLLDEPSSHRPDRIEIEVHTEAKVLAKTVVLSLLLYRAGAPVWRQARDDTGDVDIAALELDRATWPESAQVAPFSRRNLLLALEQVRVGASLLVPGYPLGFHDTVHRLPVVRQACVASAFGVRFQGLGCFLTDARTHRGTSGAPVVLAAAQQSEPGQLLGVHSSRFDMRNRTPVVDESLGLNCAWYADVLPSITESR